MNEIERVGYHVQEMRIVDDRGKRVSGFEIEVFRRTEQPDVT